MAGDQGKQRGWGVAAAVAAPRAAGAVSPPLLTTDQTVGGSNPLQTVAWFDNERRLHTVVRQLEELSLAVAVDADPRTLGGVPQIENLVEATRSSSRCSTRPTLHRRRVLGSEPAHAVFTVAIGGRVCVGRQTDRGSFRPCDGGGRRLTVGGDRKLVQEAARWRPQALRSPCS